MLHFEVLLCCFEKRCRGPVHIASTEQNLMKKKFSALNAVLSASIGYVESLHTIRVSVYRQSKKPLISKSTTLKIIPYNIAMPERFILSGIAYYS